MRQKLAKLIYLLFIVIFLSGYKSPIEDHQSDIEVKPIPAVAPDEMMEKYPSPGVYVAFSLKVAEEMIRKLGSHQNYRKIYQEVFNLGGINQIDGLVYDRKLKDIIFVGKYNPERQPITLDDFVVALKARFIYGKWPLVSIDPTEETEKTDMQKVRFEGGINNTQFGYDLLEADYRLKRIGMGLLSPGIPGLKTHWNIEMERFKNYSASSYSYNISSRFWFYPILPKVIVRGDFVSAKGLTVGVFTEVMSAIINGKKIEDLTTFQDEAGDKFAKAVSENFEALEKVHSSFSRLHGLNDLVGLVSAIENMREKPNLDYWLMNHQVKHVGTRKELKVLNNEKEYETQYSGKIYHIYRKISGGVHLMALALRVNAGDVTALKEAVFAARPRLNSLSWSFIAGEWLISLEPEMLKIEDIVPLFYQALFLLEQKRYDEAITLYSEIVKLKPDWDRAYSARGVVYADKGEYDRAIDDFNKAIEINPKFAGAYYNRGNTYADKDEYDKAIGDYSKAIEINPKHVDAYNNRGIAYAEGNGEHDLAIADYNKAIELNPKYAAAYYNRGNTYADKDEYDKAIGDYSKAIEINPRYVEAYANRGTAYAEGNGEYDLAIADYNKAIELNPKYADIELISAILVDRGYVYAKSNGEHDLAIADYNKAIELNPKYAAAYYNRGNAYISKGNYDLAIFDFNKAIEFYPRYANTYANRGIAYTKGKGEYDLAIAYSNRGVAYTEGKGEYDLAIADFNKAIEINPKYAYAYSNRGLIYHRYKGLYDLAISDFNKAIEISPSLVKTYDNRGLAYIKKGDYGLAITDFSKAIEINPMYADAYNNRGYVYMEKLGDKKRACSDWKRACELRLCTNYMFATRSGECK